MAAAEGRAYLAADTSVPLVQSTVGELLEERAAGYPHREALVGVDHGGGTVRLTYLELCEQARRAASGLTALTKPGDYVALWAPNVVEWPILQYGAALADVVLVALNPMLREPELRRVLEHCRPSVLIHADAYRNQSMLAVARRVCARVPGVQRISLSEKPRWSTAAIDDAALRQRAPQDPHMPAMLQYTSGTTGNPKGVLLDHRAMVNVAKLTMQATSVGHAARFLNPLPMFHTAGCVVSTLGPLWNAGTMVLLNPFSAETALDIALRERTDVLFYVPAMLSAMVAEQRSRSSAAPPFRVMLGGAANVSSGLILAAEACFGGTGVNLFGQTELAPVLTVTRPDDARQDRLTTVGRPLPQVDCKVVDAAGDIVGTNVVGELCARGYQQFLRYLHDPEATAAALDPEGFVRTGDLGFIDDRGYVTVTGRLKELIIRGGENISPGELEDLIARDERVERAVVFGLPDERLGEIVAAAVQTQLADGRLKEDLTCFLREQTAAYKIPERWFVVDEFPCTPTGKVQRYLLQDAIARGELVEL